METKFNLEEFNPKKAELTTLADSFRGLTIAGIEDKEGYERVHKAQMKLREVRVDIEKKGKAAREDALAYQKAVIALEKDLIAITEPVESALKAEKERIDAEKERIKKEAEEKEAARVQALVDKLAAVGFVANPFGIATMDAATFEALLAEKTEAFRISEEARLAAEAKAKADAEELEKLRSEKAAMEEEKRKIEEEKAKIQREKELEAATKAAAEKAAKDTEERLKREAEEKAKQEAELAAKAEAEKKAAEERLAKEQAYKDFLAKNGVTKESIEAGTHKVVKDEESKTVRIYELKDSFVIPE